MKIDTIKSHAIAFGVGLGIGMIAGMVVISAVSADKTQVNA